MARTAGKWLFVSLLMVVLGSTAFAAYARQGEPVPAFAPLPAIMSFGAEVNTVSYAAVEAGTARITLSWLTINTGSQHRLALEVYQGDRWVSLVAENELLGMVVIGWKELTVAVPQNYGVPTYRLTLKTTQGEVIEQQFVTLPYDYTGMAENRPSIVSFSTPVASIDTNLLVQNNTRIIVNWQIANRWPNSIIVFEQVLPDGSTVNAELPRAVLWIPSQGEGVLVARPTSLRENLVFRMTLINPGDWGVYDTAEISIPVIGHVVQAGSPAQTASNAAAVQGISAFSADTTSVAPGGSVTLNWDAGDAASVELLQNVEEGPTTLYIQLPPSGSLTVPVPEDAAGATYTLRAQSADGTVSTGEVSVSSESGEGQ
jgi:hypothetical protein